MMIKIIMIDLMTVMIMIIMIDLMTMRMIIMIDLMTIMMIIMIIGNDVYDSDHDDGANSEGGDD